MKHHTALVVFALAPLTGCGGDSPPSAVTATSTTAGSPPPAPLPANLPRRADGAVQVFAAGPGESAQNPAYSPNGRRLLFTVFHRGYNVGPAGLFLMPADASAGAAALLDEPDADSVNLPGTSWSAANGLIAFSSDRAPLPSASGEIWVVAPDGSGLRRVASIAGLYLQEPSFSPDGSTLVFEAADEAAGSASLYTIGLAGSGLRRLVSHNGVTDRQPNWSPRDDRILFQRTRLGHDDPPGLFTVRSDGSGLVQVTPIGAGTTDASWSLDARRIVYSGEVGGGRPPNLFVLPAAGGAPVRLTTDNQRADGAPSWSPDGARVAFESSERIEQPSQIWITDIPVDLR